MYMHLDISTFGGRVVDGGLYAMYTSVTQPSIVVMATGQ